VQTGPNQRKLIDSTQAPNQHATSSHSTGHTINLTNVNPNGSATITPTTICINKTVNNNNNNNNLISIDKPTSGCNNNIIHLNSIKSEPITDQKNKIFYTNSINNIESKFVINWTNNQMTNAAPNDNGYPTKQVGLKS
jgi:hypothetical protein